MAKEWTSRILLGLTIGGIAISLFFSTEKYLVKSDFEAYGKIECDPNVESCFIGDCDDGYLFCGEWQSSRANHYFYRIILKNASQIPTLDSCGDATSCTIVHCSEETLEEYELDTTCS